MGDPGLAISSLILFFLITKITLLKTVTIMEGEDISHSNKVDSCVRGHFQEDPVLWNFQYSKRNGSLERINPSSELSNV